MAHVYLALGSNQGDRLANLRAALQALGPAVRLERSSSVYETAAAYVEDQPPFLNAVVAAATDLAPPDLLAELKRIEGALGRRAGQRFGPRVIDLDILLYDDRQLASPELVIPHPRMAERAFVLVPLAEIAPDLQPAGWSQPIRTLAGQAAVGAILARVAPPLLAE